jgi:hypothetical protein|tara:strand:- start:31 stop:222 length:192 start_codon:yes stop_codon:yes gene_type:complete
MYLFNTLNHKSRTFLLLGVSALGSLVSVTPAMAEDFAITSKTTTNNMRQGLKTTMSFIGDEKV